MEDFEMYLILSLVVPIFFLLGIIVVKMIAMKELPDSRYTPVDQITGQTTVLFQEHKEEKEQRDDQGDDKDKNIS